MVNQLIKNPELAKAIIQNPHRLGNYLGYKDLDELHSEWIHYVWLAEDHNSLQAHRGSYKTTSVLIVGFLWWLLFHWNDTVAIIRKDFTSASEVLRTVTKHLKGEKFLSLFVAIYGFEYKVVTSTGAKVTLDIKTSETPEGNLQAYGKDGSLTGKHFDKIVCDDIITIRDRVSQVERDSVDELVRELMANIINPGHYVSFTGTPWHPKDTWRILPTPKKYDIYSTKIKSFTEKRIAEIRRDTTGALFAANYELRHIPSDELIFTDPSWTDTWDPTCPTYGHIDAKYQGDHTGAFTIMARKHDGRIQAVGFMFTEHIDKKYKWLVDKWRYYRCGTVYLEDNADKGYAARDLSAMGMITATYHEIENKHVKIIQSLRKYWHLIDWHTRTDPEYMAQILDYIEGMEPDDCPDSGASLIRQVPLLVGAIASFEAVTIQDEYRE